MDPKIYQKGHVRSSNIMKEGKYKFSRGREAGREVFNRI
jgi:hypothetical protein